MARHRIYSGTTHSPTHRLNQSQHAFAQLPLPSKQAQASLTLLLEQLTTQIELLEKGIYQKMKDQHPDLFDKLQSIPGIGPKTMALLLIVSKGFVSFTNYRQLIAYVGLAPRIYQSGTSIKGKGHICKVGTGRIRALLFMCALQAKFCNPPCKALFERLTAKGKPFKVALIAVANKLLKQVFAIAKSGKPLSSMPAISLPYSQ